MVRESQNLAHSKNRKYGRRNGKQSYDSKIYWSKVYYLTIQKYGDYPKEIGRS